MANRSYTTALRADAVRRVLEHGQSIGHVARDMSIGIGTIRRWIGADAGPGRPSAVALVVKSPLTGSTAPDSVEQRLDGALRRLTRLERQVHELRNDT